MVVGGWGRDATKSMSDIFNPRLRQRGGVCVQRPLWLNVEVYNSEMLRRVFSEHTLPYQNLFKINSAVGYREGMQAL